MAKISLKALKMPDLEPLIITRREYDDAAYFHEYDNCELLREVYEMSKLILKRPSCVKNYEWYVPNIFGYEYTHGYLTEMNDDRINSPIDSPEDFEEELRIHFEVQKPYQDKQLQKYWERYKDEDIVASLLAYGIDPEKFWFALLWLKQFVDDKVRNERVKYRNTIDCMEEFIKIVRDETQFEKRLFSRLEMALTLKIKGKKKLKITNPAVIVLMKNLLVKHLDELSEGENDRKTINRKLEKSAENTNENDSFFIFENEGPIHSNKNEKIYLFKEYMTDYLNARELKKYRYITELIEDGTKGKGVSVHKDYLIYRLLRVIGYLPDMSPKSPNGEPRDEKKYLKELLHNSNLEYAKEKESVTYQGFAGTEMEDD